MLNAPPARFSAPLAANLNRPMSGDCRGAVGFLELS
jgi:hypothetical protein